MYYGNQPWPVIKQMTEWERRYAFRAVYAVIRAEHRAAEDAKKQAERDAALNAGS